MEFTNQSLKFHSDAVADSALALTRLVGEERLSGLFRFELILVSDDPQIDLQAVLYKPAKVGIAQYLGRGLKTFRWFCGTVCEFQELEQGQAWTTYRAVLVPDLWKLTEFYRSRVFMGLTVDELVGEVLRKDLGLQDGVDYEFKLSRAEAGGDRKERAVYPEREYVVQFEETDLNFVQRWLEHEGVFFFFENDGTREKVVFADSVSAYKPVVPGACSYPYRPQGRTQGASPDEDGQAEEVHSFTCTATRLPKQVTLNDYNWRDPSVRLSTSHEVCSQGQGIGNHYNDHYKTEDQGKALAEVRAQEWAWRGEVYRGLGSCRALRPGRTFELEDHFRTDWNRSYLVVAVRHEADQTINLEGSTVTGANYANTFEAIPADVIFRPSRQAEWPAIRGSMHARVDAAGDGAYAELDDQGRYKLRMPFDDHEAEAGPGEASRWVRMAQPYAGVDSGFHFPLLKGTEVLITHIDGDPDRPIISAAVPNPEAVSPVDQGNQTQNRILTTSGNLIQIDDDEDRAGFVFFDSTGSFVQDYRQAGGPGSGGGTPASGQGGAAPRPAHPPVPPGAAPAPRPPRAAPAPAPLGDNPAADAIRRLAAAGHPLPLPLLRKLASGRGEDPQASSSGSALQAFLDANPDANTIMTAGTPLLASKGMSLPSDYVLDAKNFGARIRIEVGDQFKYLKGDSWKYADGSFDVSWGTGGFNFSGDMGNKEDHSFLLGNLDATSTMLGNTNSLSMTLGLKHEVEIMVGGVDKAEMVLATNKTFVLSASTNESLEITASANKKATLTLAVTEEFELTIGLGTKIELGLGGYFEFKLAAAPKITLQIAVEDIDTKIPDSQEVRLSKMETNLSDIQNELNTQQNILNDTKVKLNVTKTDLNETKTRLSETETKLTATETALNATKTKLAQTETMLNKSTMALSKRTTALADEVSALATTQTAIIHSIT